MKKIVALIIIFQASLLQVKSENAREKVLWQRYHTHQNKVSEKLEALLDLGIYYYSVQGNVAAADTLFELAMTTALHTKNKDYILKAYNAYFDLTTERITADKAEHHAQEIRNLYNQSPSNILLWHALYFESISSFTVQDFDKSFAKAAEAYSLAEAFDSTRLMLKSLLKQGLGKDWMNKKAEALGYYLSATDLAIARNKASELNLVYSAMARLFYYNHNLERSKEYRIKCVEAFKSELPIDSLALFEAEYFVLESMFGLVDSTLADQVIIKIAEAQKKEYKRMSRMYWSMLRTDLIRTGKFQQLYTLYHDNYPEELEYVKSTDLLLYWRICAYMQEYLGNKDEAFLFWQKVLESLPRENNLYLVSHINTRYAEFLLRIDRIAEAKTFGQEAYDLAVQTKFREFQISSLELLEDIALRQRDYKEAFRLTQLKQNLKMEEAESSRQDGLLLLEFQHEVDKRGIQQLREEEAQRAKIVAEEFRANAFLIGFLILVVLSVLIFRQYRLTRFEKSKSDKLLLNILPPDTAEELKKTGSTTARQYNNVTVLFCDIVGFTKVAEKLSAPELVSEIDTYFRAFDEIVKTFGLEKIKTVGDAYVAVAGMPLYNKATTVDAVHAAKAMQQKVNEFMLERVKQGKPFFELRLGLHNGTLVAGVVGSTKFQYDIWGDTVNIAARLQQSAEPGKINISECTYLEVNNTFHCTSRGFIDAKNKGAMAMYYVSDLKMQK